MDPLRTLASLCCAIPLLAVGQDCPFDYVTRQFDVRVDTGVYYGTATRYDGGTDSLKMNIYKPVGDGIAARPLLVAIHGGAFLGGHRDDMNEICSWYAERGYVAVTVSYRLGFYPPAALPSPFAYDQADVVRAAYRAQQDVKGAIRYLRGRAAADSSDTDNISVMGVSAGAITALHVAYATEESDKPASCGAIGPVVHGQDQYPRPDLGPMSGELHPGASSAVNACVSYFGAVLDTAVIADASEPALFTYHQTQDPIVGCGYQQALWGMPFGVSGNYPWLFGSCAMDPHMQALGFTSDRYEFHPYEGNAHDIHDLPLVDGWTAVFLARQFCPSEAGLIDGRTAPAPVIYPNPADDRLLVSAEGGLPFLSLYTSDGRLAARTKGNGMAVGHLAPGHYLLEVRTDQGCWRRSVTLSR
ncbi:MAG: alpha/beta hydrolase fold domain-containing protein [Flavobacteriales bacterium]|jgi:acetyl esterase/lipase|nr:alpha/beta hydrolase fold domain-containing protein [Flavobacteriales bacterium]